MAGICSAHRWYDPACHICCAMPMGPDDLYEEEWTLKWNLLHGGTEQPLTECSELDCSLDLQPETRLQAPSTSC